MLAEQFTRTRQHSESLCAPLNIEDYVPQAADFTSPPKWHLAHVTWFFEEMILKNSWAATMFLTTTLDFYLIATINPLMTEHFVPNVEL